MKKEETLEAARLFAESKMPFQEWDRKDHINLGVFYKYLVDYIMESYASQRADAIEWISVEERLPDFNTRELICVRQSEDGKSSYSIPLTWRGDGFYVFIDIYHKVNDVTHWNPLPTPPPIIPQS